MNKYGEASPAIMLALLEEAAAEHCQSINYGLYDLLKQNIGWVLVSGVMKMKRYPNYKEKIVIKTWLSGYTNVKDSAKTLFAMSKAGLSAGQEDCGCFLILTDEDQPAFLMI
jgi:acyl-ACP thioesterase